MIVNRFLAWCARVCESYGWVRVELAIGPIEHAWRRRLRLTRDGRMQGAIELIVEDFLNHVVDVYEADAKRRS